MRKRGANFRYKTNSLAPVAMMALRTATNDDQRYKLSLMGWQSLDIIKRGEGDEESFSCLACCVNVTTMLTEEGVGIEYMQYCKDALEAVRRIGKRGRELGKYVGDGRGYEAISLALELYDQQIKQVTQYRILDAIRKVDRQLMKQRAQREKELL